MALQHLAHRGSRQVKRVREVALRDAVVGGEQTQADGLAGVGAVRRQCPRHQLLVETQRRVERTEDLSRELVHALERRGRELEGGHIICGGTLGHGAPRSRSADEAAGER